MAGWLWVGGAVHTGAWHSEYHCLMNGSHDNYAFTQVGSEDPTANVDGSYTDENHLENLRDSARFCAWCQEIVTIRIQEKTDQLTEPDDPPDPTEQGRVWLTRWESERRENYFVALSVDQQISDAETCYAAMAPGRLGEPLWQSDLYGVPLAGERAGVRPGARVRDDGESFLLLGYAGNPLELRRRVRVRPRCGEVSLCSPRDDASPSPPISRAPRPVKGHRGRPGSRCHYYFGTLDATGTIH